MMAAYLQGHTRPSFNYGLMSRLTESVILELVSAQIAAKDYEMSAMVDIIRLPLLQAKSMQDVSRSVDARVRRARDLRFAQIFADEKVFNKNMPSLYQLYQIAQKHGIMDALQAYNPPTKPILRR